MEKPNKFILVIEDDKNTQSRLKNELKNRGYRVACVGTAQEGIDFCIKNIVNMVLLDLGLPDRDGMYIIETLRTFNNSLPIIVISGRTAVESKVLALDAGANDYITKPFNMEELAARMRKEFRYLAAEERHLFINGPLSIDFDAKNVCINGQEVHFTNFEYKIIVLLANNIGKTLDYDYMIDHIWGKGGQDQNGLRVFMAGIRKKISKDTRSSQIIRTDIGVGYRMNKID